MVIFSALQQGNSPVPVSSRSEIHQETVLKSLELEKMQKVGFWTFFGHYNLRGNPQFRSFSVHWIITGYYKK